MAAEDATETNVPGDAAKFPGRDWVRSVLQGPRAAEERLQLKHWRQALTLAAGPAIRAGCYRSR